MQTPAEQALWFALRAKRVADAEFGRQVPVGPFIVDFAARSYRLAPQIDGDTHAAQTAYDARRTALLEQQGYRVIRFTTAEIMRDIDGAPHAIGAALAKRDSALPTLSPAGRGPFPRP